MMRKRDFDLLPRDDGPTVEVFFPKGAGVTLNTVDRDTGAVGGPVVLRFEPGVQRISHLLASHSYLRAQGMRRLDQEEEPDG